MGTFERIPGSSDFTDGDYWRDVSDGSTGTAPTSGSDNFSITEGSDLITLNVGAETNFGSIFIGGNFSGQFATSGTPFRMGTVTRLHVNAPLMQGFHFHPTALGTLVVEACKGVPGSCVFANGTITDGYILGGERVTIGAAATIGTALYVEWLRNQSNDVKLYIEPGATIPLLEQFGGYVFNEADITTVNVDGGLFENLGVTEGDISALNVRSGRALLHSRYATYGFIGARNGQVLLDRERQTVTNSTVFSGGRMDSDVLQTFTNPTKVAGGIVNGYGGKTIVIPPAPLP